MQYDEPTEEERKLLMSEFEKFRADTVAEAARTKTPDEAAQAGYNIGYNKGFMDGMNLGYAEGVRDEKKGRA